MAKVLLDNISIKSIKLSGSVDIKNNRLNTIFYTVDITVYLDH